MREEVYSSDVDRRARVETGPLPEVQQPSDRVAGVHILRGDIQEELSARNPVAVPRLVVARPEHSQLPQQLVRSGVYLCSLKSLNLKQKARVMVVR